jgi:hypothetical protein
MPPTPSAQLSRAVTAVSVVGTAAGLGLVAAVEVIRAAATATAARATARAVADIKAAEIPKATGALAEVTLAMVTPAVMIPDMVISRKLMMLVVMVESGVIDALMAGRPPTRSNATVRLPSLGRRRWPERSIVAHGIPVQGSWRHQARGHQLRQEDEDAQHPGMRLCFCS